MKVLIACEFSGTVRDAFIKKGHDAISCDLLPTESPGMHLQGDLFSFDLSGYDLIIAHPPCTYLTCAGNKWFNSEYKERFPNRIEHRRKALDFFLRIAQIDSSKICIENPIGIMSTAWRKPDQIIQPYHFGHNVRKSTCLWLKNLSALIPTEIVEPEIKRNKNGNTASVWHDKLLGLPPEERTRERSRTFQGIADAMAEQWG